MPQVSTTPPNLNTNPAYTSSHGLPIATNPFLSGQADSHQVMYASPVTPSMNSLQRSMEAPRVVYNSSAAQSSFAHPSQSQFGLSNSNMNYHNQMKVFDQRAHYPEFSTQMQGDPSQFLAYQRLNNPQDYVVAGQPHQLHSFASTSPQNFQKTMNYSASKPELRSTIIDKKPHKSMFNRTIKYKKPIKSKKITQPEVEPQHEKELVNISTGYRPVKSARVNFEDQDEVVVLQTHKLKKEKKNVKSRTRKQSKERSIAKRRASKQSDAKQGIDRFKETKSSKLRINQRDFTKPKPKQPNDKKTPHHAVKESHTNIQIFDSELHSGSECSSSSSSSDIKDKIIEYLAHKSLKSSSKKHKKSARAQHKHLSMNNSRQSTAKKVFTHTLDESYGDDMSTDRHDLQINQRSKERKELFKVDICGEKVFRLAIHEGDNIPKIVHKFGELFKVKPKQRAVLTQRILAQYEMMMNGSDC